MYKYDELRSRVDRMLEIGFEPDEITKICLVFHGDDIIKSLYMADKRSTLRNTFFFQRYISYLSRQRDVVRPKAFSEIDMVAEMKDSLDAYFSRMESE